MWLKNVKQSIKNKNFEVKRRKTKKGSVILLRGSVLALSQWSVLHSSRLAVA